MKTDILSQLKNAFETSRQYFVLFHMAYFYEDLSRRINVSRLARNISIQTPQGSQYTLSASIIEHTLQEIYDNPLNPSFFSHLLLLNTLRGITMSLVAAFDNKNGKSDKEFLNVYKTDIFLGNDVITDSFEGVTRFIRNVLSHNIEDKLCVRETDYVGQREYRNSLKNKFGPLMKFQYEHSDPTSAVHIPGYSPGLLIELDLNSITPGQDLGSIIPTYQSILFTEFCYNSLFFLYQKYIKV